MIFNYVCGQTHSGSSTKHAGTCVVAGTMCSSVHHYVFVHGYYVFAHTSLCV